MKIRKIKGPKIRIRRPRIRIRWKKRTSRWVVSLAILFFISLFTLQLVLMNYSKSILQNVLNMQLEEASGGLYSSDFDDIEISYTKKNLLIRNLRLLPQKQVSSRNDSVNDTEPNSYEILIPEVHINGINLRKAYLENFLEINSIELLEAKIKLHLNFDEPQSKFSDMIREDLSDLLPPAVDELRVKRVDFQNAYLEINTIKNQKASFLQVTPLQIELENFHLNPRNTRNPEKLFYTDQIFLEADSLFGHLSGGTYELKLEALKMSSADSSAFARNISLKPLEEIEKTRKKAELDRLYSVKFPQLYLYGLSFKELYHKQNFVASEITLLSPELALFNLKAPSPGEKESFKIVDLYPAIDKVLNSVRINNLYLRNGQIDIQEFRTKMQEKMSANVQLAYIKQFILDSLSSQRKSQLLFSEQIDLHLKDYSLRLSDDLHLLQADELFFSSQEAEVKAKGFRVAPEKGNLKRETSPLLYKAQAPLIHLHGVDMLKAYHQNILDIDSLQLQEPNLSLSNNGIKTIASSNAQKRFEEEDLYALVEDYLYALSVQKIMLKQGKLSIKNKKSTSEDFATKIRRAGLWNFRLDSTSAYQMNKLFYADDFELEIADYEHDLPDDTHRITADEIGISTLSEKIYISDLHISEENSLYPYPKLETSTSKTLLDLQVPYLELDGVDILNAYLHKKLQVREVNIPSPSIQLGTLLGKGKDRTDLIKSSALFGMIKEYLESIQVQHLYLKNGQLDLAFYAEENPLTVSGRQTNIRIDNFRFDSLTSSNPKRLFFADNVEVEVADYESRLPDGIHIIRAGKLNASTIQKKIKASEIWVNTSRETYSDEELINEFKQRSYLSLHLPEIFISGLDFDQAYYNERLLADTVFAFAPDVRYTYLPRKTLENKPGGRKLKQTDFYNAISPYLEEFGVKRLVMEEGRFSSLRQENGQQEENTHLEGISFQMDDFLVDSSAVYNSKKFLYAEDIRLQIEKYKQELLDHVHLLKAEELKLSTRKQKIEAANIQLKPKLGLSINKISIPQQYIIDLPALKISGIGFDKVYKNGELEIQELLLESPEFLINNYPDQSAEKAKKAHWASYDLHELIKGNLKSLKVERAHISQGRGTYIQHDGQKAFQFKTDHYSANIKKFQVSDDKNVAHNPFYAEDIQLSLNGFERKTADSLHVLRIEKLRLSTQEEVIALEGIQLNPRPFPDFEERLRLTKKDKLFKVKVPRVELHGLHASKFKNDSLVFRQIQIHEPSLEIIHYPELKGESQEQEKGWQQQLLANFKLIETEEAQLQGGKLTYTTVKNGDSNTFLVGNIQGKASNFKVDSLAGTDPDRLFFSDQLQIQIQDYFTSFDDDLYELRVKKIALDTKERTLTADSLEVTPLVERDVFAEKKGYETDQFTVRNRHLKIQNLDFPALFQKGNFLADSLLMQDLSLYVYRDKRQPYPEDHFPKMPQEILRNLNFPLFIKGIEIENGYIGYAEQVKGARSPGFIDLTDLHIVSDTISNHPVLLKHGLTTNLKLNCYLMGTGHLQAEIHIPLGDTLNRHTFFGSLDEMYLPDFNPILENTVFIKIRSGYADQIYFYIEADQKEANGSMEFQYRGLKVALVNKKTGNTGGVFKEIGSLVANAFVVNTNNTERENKPVRKGKMAYPRDERRSVVNYWVKTLVNGFKSSIGL